MSKFDIGERLRAARTALGWSQERLAAEVQRRIGGGVTVSRDLVRSWEVGRVKLYRHEAKVRACAEALKITYEELLEGEESVIQIEAKRMRLIPVLGEMSAGSPGSPTGDVEYIEIEDWGGSRMRWGRRVRGDSMTPPLLEGDIAIFEDCAPESGDIVHAYDAGKDTIKVMRLSDGRPVLEALNPDYAPIDGEGWHVKGSLVEIKRELGGGIEVTIRNKWGGPLKPGKIPVT